MSDLAALRAVVRRAVEELDAEHEPQTLRLDDDELWVECRWCDHKWPCPSKLVADELRQALGEQ